MATPGFDYNPRREQPQPSDPRQEELLRQTEGAKTCKLYFDTDLTETQRLFILDKINSEISLSTDRDHHIQVEIISDSEFTIIIDNTDKFHIIGHKKDEGTGTVEKSPIIVVQERIKVKSFTSSVREFFQAIANLFYKPTYPSKLLKQRSHREAISQDYRALRKSFENGQQWISSAKSIQMSAKDMVQRKKMEREVASLISNAKKVEKALGAKNQAQEMERLADEFSARITELTAPEHNPVVIPIGYRNQDGSLQPVMLRFFRNESNHLVLEIYADTYEGKGKVTPLHSRKFSGDHKMEDIKAVLDAALNPLISGSARTAALKKAAKPNETFAAMADSQFTPILEEAIAGLPKREGETKKATATPSETRTASLTFEQFLRSIDRSMTKEQPDGSTKMFWTDSTPEDQRLKRQPSNPSERVVGWFNHLLGSEKNKLSRNEKLNLLFFLTEDYVQDQLRQLKRKPPLFKKPSPEKQLAIYKNAAGQIAHMRERIAVSLNGDNPLDNRAIPQSLKDAEVLCLERIAHLENKILESKRAGASAALSRTHSSQISGVSVGNVELAPPVEPVVAPVEAAEVERLDEIEWAGEWRDNLEQLKTLLSPEQISLRRGRQIVREFVRIQERNGERLLSAENILNTPLIDAKKYTDLSEDKQTALIKTILNSPIPLSVEQKSALQQALDTSVGAPDKSAVLEAANVQAAVAQFAANGEIKLLDLQAKRAALKGLDLQELVDDGKLNAAKLEEVIQAVVDSMDQSALGSWERKGISSEQLVSIIKQMLISPHMIPYYPRIEGSMSLDDFFKVFHLAIDPQHASGSAYSPISEDLRALLDLRLLLPKQQLDEEAKIIWEQQIDALQQNGVDLIKGKIDQFIETMTAGINVCDQTIETYKAELDKPEADAEEVGRKIAQQQQLKEVNEVTRMILQRIKAKDSIEEIEAELKTAMEELRSELAILKETNAESPDIPKYEQVLAKLEESLSSRPQRSRDLSIIKGLRTFPEKLNQLRKIPDMFTPSNLERLQASPDLAQLTRALAHSELSQYNTQFCARVNQLSAQLQQLSEAAAREPDIIKKQAMYEEIKTRSIQLLRLLPPPGTEGTHQTPSIWRSLNSAQRAEMRRNVQQLERHTWESQLRLSKTDLTGTEKFLMVKGQTIGMALIREDVKEQKSYLEQFLTDLRQKDPEKFSKFSDIEGIKVNETDGRVEINLKKMNTKLIRNTMKKISDFVVEAQNQSARLRKVHSELDPSVPVPEQDRALIQSIMKNHLIRTGEASFNQNGITWNINEQELTFNWDAPELNWENIFSSIKDGSVLLNDYPPMNPLLLALDAYTLDTHSLNIILTQDLTTCLSLDPSLERELQTVYHFIVMDQNRGIHDYLRPEGKDLENNSDVRTPILESVVKGTANVPPANPMLLELYAVYIFHPRDNDKRVLLKFLTERKSFEERISKPLNREVKRQLETLGRESFTSPSGAISWNKDTGELVINWKSPELERSLLMALFRESSPEIRMQLDLLEMVDQTAKNELYLSTASDPDFTLYDTQNAEPTGRSFVQLNPLVFLGTQSPIDVVVSNTQVGDYSIETATGEKLSEIHVFGKPGEADHRTFGYDQWIREGEDHLFVKPKKPFLPATNQGNPDSGGTDPSQRIRDIRDLKTYDAWHAYVEEIAGSQVLSVPTHVLEGLFKIRQAPADNREGTRVTSYSTDTALLALEFMTNSDNQPYIKHDFVQNYLLETLFGPMVLQQALIDHPEDFISNIDKLKEAMIQAQVSRNHELVGFCSIVLDKLEGHIQETREQLQEQGIFSSSLRTLPGFRDKGGIGGLYRCVQNRTDQLRSGQVEGIFTDYSRNESILQPLVEKLEHIELLAIAIENAKEAVHDDSDKSIPRTTMDILLSGEKGKRPIDKITDPVARRQAYTYLLQDYRSVGVEALDETDFKELLNGYVLLKASPETMEDEQAPGRDLRYSSGPTSGLPALEADALAWIREDVLPFVQTMNAEQRDDLLKGIVNAKITADGQDPIQFESVRRFSPVESHVNRYKLNTGTQTIVIDLSTMEIGGIVLTKKTRGSAAIPKHLMQRKDFQQAFGTSVIEEKITKTEREGIATYSWSHQGQAFTLRTNGTAVEITRKITTPPRLAGTYTFHPIKIKEAESHASKILNENGIWTKNEDPRTGYVLASGMDLPYKETIYTAPIIDQQIHHLSTLDGKHVAATSLKEADSPVLFADADNTVIIVEPESETPIEVRIPALGIAMSKKDGSWEVSQKGKSLGTLKAPDKEENNALRAAFGEHWDQFVIPVERDVEKVTLVKGKKVTTPVKETVYLMIPYRQQVDKNGAASVDHKGVDAIPGNFEMRISDGQVTQGSMAANLYMAHRFLMQAEKAQNPTIARGFLMQAQTHLEKVQGQPAPTNPQEIEQLQYVINEMSANPAVTVRPPPTLEGLSIALKMELFVQHIRGQAQKQGIKPLEADSEQELNEQAKIAKMYHAYTVLRHAAGKKYKLHKEMFALTDKEFAVLANINQRMLQTLSAPEIGSTTAERYFGATGRLAAAVTMERPKTLEPQLMLALVRMAKARDKNKTLKGVIAPLRADDLIENFWSYLASIKKEGLTTQDLLFLFEESVIPPTDSPDQEQQLRDVDLQARQLLLSMADLMNKAGGKVAPMKHAKEGLEESKNEVLDTERTEEIVLYLAQFKGKPNIAQHLRTAMGGIGELEVTAISDTEPPIPDIDKLVRDIANNVKSPLENFRDEMATALSEAESLINETSAEYEKRNREFSRAKRSLKQAKAAKEEVIAQLREEYSKAAVVQRIKGIEEERRKTTTALKDQKGPGVDPGPIDVQIEQVWNEAQEKVRRIEARYGKAAFGQNLAVLEEKHDAKIAELKEKKNAAEASLKQYSDSIVHDPLTGEMMDRGTIVTGEYAKLIDLEKLRRETDNVKTAVEKLDKGIKEMIEGGELLKQWGQLQEMMRDIETVQFSRSDWFTLPESGAARAFIESQLLGGGEEEREAPSMLSTGASLVKQLGPRTAVRLGLAAREHESLTQQLRVNASELDGLDLDDPALAVKLAEREKLMNKLLSNPMGNLMAAGKALGPLVVAGAATDFTPIVCEPPKGRSGAVETVVTLSILDDSRFKECFTESERAVISENLSKLDGQEQKSYVEQLKAALGMRASLLDARLGTQSHLESIKGARGRVIGKTPKAQSAPTPHSFEEISGESLTGRYADHFTSSAGFTDKANVPAVFSKLMDDTFSNQSTLGFLLKKAGELAQPILPDRSQHERLEKMDATIAEIRREIQPQPIPIEFEPYIDALALIGKASTADYRNKEGIDEILGRFVDRLRTPGITGKEFLIHIRDAHNKLAPRVAAIEHHALIAALTSSTLPEDSLVRDEMLKGLDRIAAINPLGFSTVIGEDQVERVETAILEDVARLEEQVKEEEDEIVRRLEAVQLGNLPKSVQKVRMRRGSRKQLLEAAYKEYRRGGFDPGTFKAGTIPEGAFPDHDLDTLIGKCLLDDTRRQVLRGSRYNAFNAVQNLYRLREEKAAVMLLRVGAPATKAQLIAEKQQLEAQLGDVDNWIPDLSEYSPAEQQAISAVLNEETVPLLDGTHLIERRVYSRLQNYYVKLPGGRSATIPKATIDADVDQLKTDRALRKHSLEDQIATKQREHDHYDEELTTHLAGINANWKKESKKISDFTDRCQSQTHLTTDLGSLEPYARQINYLQQKMGIVLREDQIQTLKEIIDNKALLKQLRMGLGKTSVILPFALMILSAEDNNAIGMVPKALFDTNFDEMDETTRSVFEMAGSQFLFSRQDVNLPISKLSLHELSTKCAEFFDALDRGEYILTTIESKASLDNKIIEIERSQAFIQERIDEIIDEDPPDKDDQIDALYPQLVEHQMALDMLYSVKAVFEAEKTRLIIDEIDSVAKSNKTVNSEIGDKAKVSADIQQIATDIFDVIRGNEQLKGLLDQILTNNQFTLNESKVNGYLKIIAAHLIKGIDLQGHKEEDVLKWMAGEKTRPFSELEWNELGADAKRLTYLRAALNNSLRSSLGLKAGLSADFDATHGAIGVPASQGVTSKTTKFSDPLMQVILSQMIALYKPQGETYLNAAAREVIGEMKMAMREIDGLLSVMDADAPGREKLLAKRTELRDGIRKLSSVVIPDILLNETKQELKAVEAELVEKADDPKLLETKASLEQELRELADLVRSISPDSPPSIQRVIASNDKLSVFLRFRFAQQVAKKGLIYVSSNELARSNQHALRGCHVIGLTGTATHNTKHVITSTGHTDAMKGISESGRETTAEVVYRFVNALRTGSQSAEEVLASPVQTYSLQTSEALQQFINIARPGSGYRFLINQAGACDEMRLREITRTLHEQCDRPIIYLDMDEEGRTEKVALINGVRRPLKELNTQEKHDVEEHGFTYYHTPHVRGTHFDLPGSKGAIMLSPTVNANDRDQALYRARGLGEEHAVVPFISQKQSAEYTAANKGRKMTIGDLLKIQHVQTKNEESNEDLSAYVLHIKGQTVLAADRAKKHLQLDSKTALQSLNRWTESSHKEENQARIEARVKAFTILESLSVRDTGNEAYLRMLESQARQGGSMPTDEYLRTVVIRHELDRIRDFIAKVDEIETADKPEFAKALQIVKKELLEAHDRLEAEIATIKRDWDEKLSRQYPAIASAAPATQETAETEAEAEAEAEAVAETTADSEAETARKKRTIKTREILTVPDYELLDSLTEQPKRMVGRSQVETITAAIPEMANTAIARGWNEHVGITRRLRHLLEMSGNTKIPETKVFVIEKRGHPVIILGTAEEANAVKGHSGGAIAAYYTREGAPLSTEMESVTGYTVTPWQNPNGELELQFGGTSITGKAVRDDFDDRAAIKGEIYLSLIHVGFSPISDKGWSDIEAYWKALTEELDEAQRKHIDAQEALRQMEADIKDVQPHEFEEARQVIAEMRQDAEKAVARLEAAQKAVSDVQTSLDAALKVRNPTLLGLAAAHMWDKPDEIISLGGGAAKESEVKVTNVDEAKQKIREAVGQPWVRNQYREASKWIAANAHNDIRHTLSQWIDKEYP